MKIIVASQSTKTGDFRFYLKPDTTILLKNSPFFYPTFSSQIECNFQIAIKICRLGKNIKQRFAEKYYSEGTYAISFIAKDLYENAMKDNRPVDCSIAFDGSTFLGIFFPLSHLMTSKATIQVNENLTHSIQFSAYLNVIDPIIEYISSFMTLKIGDILLLNIPYEPFEPLVGEEIIIGIDEMEKIRIK